MFIESGEENTLIKRNSQWRDLWNGVRAMRQNLTFGKVVPVLLCVRGTRDDGVTSVAVPFCDL